MIHYRDMTFCRFYEECHFGQGCPRALTDEVKASAIKWWGRNYAPIMKHENRPSCFMAHEDVPALLRRQAD